MARYYVFHITKQYCRCIETSSGFDATRTLARACRAEVTDFYAVRADLISDHDRRRMAMCVEGGALPEQ